MPAIFVLLRSVARKLSGSLGKEKSFGVSSNSFVTSKRKGIP